jgi:Ca2+-binding RTX toxin-like protein
MVQLYRRQGADTLVNSQTEFDQRTPDVASLPGGGYVVVWGDSSLAGGDSSGTGVKGQRFDSQGNRLGGEFLVNSTITANQSAAAVAALPSGRFVVTWSDSSATGGDTSASAVRGQLFEADGTRVGGEFLINSVTAGSQSTSAVTALAGGGFAVSWSDTSAVGNDTSGSGIKAQLFDSSGGKVGGEISVNSTTDGAQNSSSIAGLPSGGFAVAWISTDPSSLGSTRLQLFDSAGARIGTEIHVNGVDGSSFGRANIAVLADGFVVSWTQYRSDSAQDTDVLAQRFDFSGNRAGPEFLVNSSLAGNQLGSDAIALPGGGFILTWQGPNGSNAGDVFGQIFDSVGAPAGSEFVVSSVTDGDQLTPRVAALASGAIVVAWSDSSGAEDHSGFSVKSQILTPSAAPATDIALSATSLNENAVENVAVATLSATRAVNSLFTYQIVADSSGGAFRIDGDRLVVADNARLDFETAPQATLTIRATDIDGQTYDEVVVLDVTDIANEKRLSAGDEIRVNSSVAGSQGDGIVTALAGGGFAVIWNLSAYGDAPIPQATLLRLYDSAGQPQSGDILIVDEWLPNLSVAPLADGGFVLTHGVLNGATSMISLSAQRYDSAGQPVGAEMVAGSLAYYTDAATVQLTTGGFVMAWMADLGEVHAQRFGSNGVATSAEFTVTNQISATPFSLVATPNGGFAAAWIADEEAPGEARVQFFDAVNVPLGNFLSVDIGSDPGSLALLALAGGGYLLGWRELAGQDQSGLTLQAVMAQPIGAGGTATGGPVVLATYVDHADSGTVSFAAAPDGGFAATWPGVGETIVEGQVTTVYDILEGRLFNSAGAPVGSQFQVAPRTWDNSDVAVLANGSIVAIWTAPDGDEAGTFARLYRPANEPVSGTGGNDVLTGDSGANVLDGGAGNDELNGLGGGDLLKGGDGSDRLYSHVAPGFYQRPYYGNPVVQPALDRLAEADTLSGGAGNDLLSAGYGDNVDGGADVDSLLISFMGAPSGVSADFRLLATQPSITVGGAVIQSVEAIEWLEGSDHADFLAPGDGSANFAPIYGRGGDDQIVTGYYSGDTYGGDGDDVIDRSGSQYGFFHYGEAGNDTIIGGSSYERLDGGEGNDILSGNYGFDDLYGGNGDDTLDGGSFGDNLFGGAGNDRLYGAGDADIVEGGDGDDLIYGDYSPTSSAGGLSPASNDDLLRGGAGKDVIHGDQGNDTIEGGADADTLYGDAGNDLLRGGSGADSFDGGANLTADDPLAFYGDRIDFADRGATQGAAADLRTGAIANDGFGNAETMTGIESLGGGTAFADTFHGDDQRNVLVGGRGDSLYAHGGDDRVELSLAALLADGGSGADLLRLRNDGGFLLPDSNGDGLAEVSGPVAGGWTVNLATGQVRDGLGNVGTIANFENIEGSGGNDSIVGSSAANILIGGDGDDVLNGAGGADRMEGGQGNDVFKVDNAGDLVVELAFGGADTVATTISYALTANVENLQAANIGGNDPLSLTGNALNNYIWGTQGNNVLNGAGGADFMLGYAGDDFYQVDNAGDIAYELAGGGADTVATSISYTLAANVENLQALAIGGNDPLALTGNALNNFIWATQGDNILNGGAGADFMIGYAGNDIYHVDNSGDLTLEEANGGTDTVVASIDYRLGANIENLQALNIAGTAALSFTGNDLRNFIWATQGNNVIDGGAGADVMVGYGGNDFYYVDNAADIAYEEAGGGSDTVAATASYTLGANIENLQAAAIGGSAALNLTGNDLNNYIWGTQGNNILAGGGGIDRLYGYAGADQFLFNTAAGAANYDVLGDFQAGVDKIALDNNVFTALSDGALPASAFVAGTAALDADDRILFNAADGSVYYDSDGSGAGAALLVAYVPVGQVLTAADFIVV